MGVPNQMQEQQHKGISPITGMNSIHTHSHRIHSKHLTFEEKKTMNYTAIAPDYQLSYFVSRSSVACLELPNNKYNWMNIV